MPTYNNQITYNTDDQRIWSKRYNFYGENLTIFLGFKLPPFKQCKFRENIDWKQEYQLKK